MSIKGLEKLEAWTKAKDFAAKVYAEVLPLLPPEEKWGLNQQISRAAVSISANIAEGYGRFYYQDNVRYCYNARGSLEEFLSHIALAHQFGFLPDPLFIEFERLGEDLTRLINGYIAYLKRSKQGSNEPGVDRAIHEQVETYSVIHADDFDESRLSTLESRGDEQ